MLEKMGLFSGFVFVFLFSFLLNGLGLCADGVHADGIVLMEGRGDAVYPAEMDGRRYDDLIGGRACLAIFSPFVRPADLLSKFSEQKTLDGESDCFFVVNTHWRAREGICYLGEMTGAWGRNDCVRVYRNHHGHPIVVQFVPIAARPGFYSVYGDFSYADPEKSVPAFGAVTLRYDVKATEQRVPLDVSLCVERNPFVLRNNSIRLELEESSGSICRFSLKGMDHDLVASEGSGGWNALYQNGNVAPVKCETVQVLAEGPLVASVAVESSGAGVRLSKQITIFDDSEKLRLDNVLTRLDGTESVEFTAAFPFHLPDATRYVDVRAGKNGPTGSKIPIARFCTIAAETEGVNWVSPDAETVYFDESGDCLFVPFSGEQTGSSEYWLWPYTASFHEGIARRFAAQICRPLLALPCSFDCDAVPGVFSFDQDRIMVVSEFELAEDGSGAIRFRLWNPTDSTESIRWTKSELYEKLVYTDRDGKVTGEVGRRFSLAAGEEVFLRLITKDASGEP